MSDEEIREPGIYDIVIFHDDNEISYPVLIAGGRYLSNGRVSNWFTFYPILPNRELDFVKSTYGNFTKYKGRWKSKVVLIDGFVASMKILAH